MKKIYLAGPDVFRVNAIEHGNTIKAICRTYGFDPLYPLDNELPKGLLDNSEKAQHAT